MKKNGLLLLSTLLSMLIIVNCSPDDGDRDPDPILYTASISSASSSVDENGGTVMVTVSLDKENEGDAISFDLSFSGTATLNDDFSTSAQSGTIANSSSSATIMLTGTDDSDAEGNETISITLSFTNSNVTVGNSSPLSITLQDDDSEQGPPTFTASISSASSSIAENGGTATFTVELDKTNQGNPLSFELALSGTGTLDTDYSVSSETREIGNGSSSTSFTVTGIDDSDVEGDETISIGLTFSNHSNVTVNTGELSFTLLDDDSGTGACDGTTDSYSIDLDASGCMESAETDLGVSSVYTVEVTGDNRVITSNGIPDHNIGMFPNQGNPNEITVQEKTFTIDATPTKTSNSTSLTTSNGSPRYWFGILDNSVVLAPIANEFFTNTSTGEDNRDWNENALSSNINLGTDCNNAHVFPTGRYHHHATPSAYVADRNIGSSTPTQVGWAADGFPIYYKYGNKDGSVVELASGFRLKTTERGGDDVSAPGGCPDGTYVEDYEYVEGLGDLDECNGYEDPTLGYIYVITDTFPSIPRCFFGTPSDDFTNN